MLTLVTLPGGLQGNTGVRAWCCFLEPGCENTTWMVVLNSPGFWNQDLDFRFGIFVLNIVQGLSPDIHHPEVMNLLEQVLAVLPVMTFIHTRIAVNV